MKITLTVTYDDQIDPDDEEGQNLIEYYYPPHVLEALLILLGANRVEIDGSTE